MRPLLIIFFNIALICTSFSSNAKSIATLEVLDLVSKQNDRPIKVNLWYPRGSCEESETKRCLAYNSITSRVIVFSHGSMGSANEYSWLLKPLAEQGAIIVAISHYGESWVYGRETIDPSSVLMFWQRAQDISEALDQLASKDMFDLSLNWNNVVAMGHSAGGQTAVALAGAQFDANQAKDYCQSDASKGDRGCHYAKSPSRSISSPRFLKMFSSNYEDKRVSALVMLDPAIGSAATKESLSKITIPALIIGAKDNEFLPFEHHAKRYSDFLVNSILIALDQQEGHFVFIDECDHEYEAQGVSLCNDREGVSRASVHQNLSAEVKKFLEQNIR